MNPKPKNEDIMGVATYIKDEKDAIQWVILQSGIEVKPVYTPEDLKQLGFDYQPGLDHPPVYGIRYTGGDQRAIQVDDLPRADRVERGLRSPHPDGI